MAASFLVLGSTVLGVVRLCLFEDFLLSVLVDTFG